MPVVPNERLVLEAHKKRVAAESVQPDGRRAEMTEKGRRELSALFAIQASVRRGEQPPLDFAEALIGAAAVAGFVDKIIPPTVEGSEEL